MKKYIRSNKDKLLRDLTEDILYQVHDNYPESTIEDASDIVLEHVILVITEMDEDGIYSDLFEDASQRRSSFVRKVQSVVSDSYYDYKWYTE